MRTIFTVCVAGALIVALGPAFNRGSETPAPPVQEQIVQGTAQLPVGFVDKAIATGLEGPTAFAFLPGDRILIAQKSGVVRVLDDGNLLPTPFIDLTEQVNSYYERGLLGIAVDPDFASNGYVYLLYTYEDDASEFDGPKTSRLSRVTANGSTAPISSETVILGTQNGPGCVAFPLGADCLPADAKSHTVGSVRFASDETLFVSNGDATPYNTPASVPGLRPLKLDSLAGKLLHITREGEGVESNPFYDGDVDSNLSKVWAYGLRNGFRFHLRDGTLPYVGDVGSIGWEEINVVPAGTNLGWPCYEGVGRHASYENFETCVDLYEEGASAVVTPLLTYKRSGGSAIVGGDFYTGSSYPREYRDAYFFGDFVRSTLSYLKVDGDNELESEPVEFMSDAGGPVEIVTGPGGDIYYLGIASGELRRIRYPKDTSDFPKHGDLPGAANPHSVTTSDFDGDGDLDLISGNTSNHTVGVHVGDGSGSFEPPVHLTVPGKVKFALPVDLDGDDVPDLVSANENTHDVSVLLSDNGDSFEPPATYSACTGPHEVQAGLLDDDGRPDLVVACHGGSLVSVLLNSGGGTFAPAVNYASGAAPHSIAITDVNEDGDQDIAVANHSGANVGILLGIGDGSFTSPDAVPTAEAPHEVRAADLNSDGHIDLATANDGSDTISVLLGDGTGAFATSVNYPAGNNPMSLAVADYDGDGIKDLATANSGGYPQPTKPTSVGVFLGNGDGTFESMLPYATGPHPFSIAAADVDEDGRVDLVTANYNEGGYLSVHLNERTRILHEDTSQPGGGGGGGGSSGVVSTPSSTGTPSPSVSPVPELPARTILEHPRTVSLRVRVKGDGHMVARGRVSVQDEEELCARRVGVNLKRAGRVVARALTNTEGGFRVRFARRSGPFAVVVPRFSTDDDPIHICLGARSTRRVRR